MALDGAAGLRLHEAFREGDIGAIRSIIANLGPFPNTSPGPAFGLPLEYAIYHAPLSLIRELLDAGADPNGSDDSGFPSLIAAIGCSTPAPGAPARDDVGEVVELLLDHGADVSQRGLDGETPLHVAATHGQVAIVERLLDRGADPDATTRIDDSETPLDAARRVGQREVGERLAPLTSGSRRTHR